LRDYDKSEINRYEYQNPLPEAGSRFMMSECWTCCRLGSDGPRKRKTMKKLFSPNIGNQGRLIRGLLALLLLVGAGFGFVGGSPWLGLVLLAAGVFALFESLRGWCALRACGIKTKY
jgi:Protein of unknown function (DUF2892)